MSGGFKFRLNVVRDIRKREQDAQRRVVAEAVRAVVGVRGRIGQFEAELEGETIAARGERGARYLDMTSVRNHYLHRGAMKRSLSEAREQLGKSQAKLDDEREKLAQATKRLNVIVRLYEKRKLRYDTWVRRREQAVWDEAALQFHGRQQETGVVKIGKA